MKLLFSFFLVLSGLLHVSAQSSDDSAQVIQEVHLEIIDFPDIDASFPGGNHLFKAWIKSNLIYPKISHELGEQGQVYVTFIVELDGSISDAEVLQGGISDELNQEALRLIRSMPLWTPSQMKGKVVRTKCRVPVTFVMEG